MGLRTVSPGCKKKSRYSPNKCSVRATQSSSKGRAGHAYNEGIIRLATAWLNALQS